MGWLFCNLDRPRPETSRPVAVTNPATHPRTKARSLLFYESSIAFEGKMKVQTDLKICSDPVTNTDSTGKQTS